MATRTRFDKPYYDRFYGRAQARPAIRRDKARLAAFVCAYLDYLRQPVRNVLDVGCGFGLWRDAIARHCPKATYTGVEISEYLCEKHGWTRGSVVDFTSPRRFDLVICDDTLQYLPTADCTAAIGNLATLCRGALFVHALTREDWRDNCDRSQTDPDVYLHSGAWYRRQLGRHFENVGGGVFLSEDSPAIAWTLGKLDG